jgi:hypothetical protein
MRSQKNIAMSYNKKFSEELIAYFHLMLHGPHRKPTSGGGDTDMNVIS